MNFPVLCFLPHNPNVSLQRQRNCRLFCALSLSLSLMHVCDSSFSFLLWMIQVEDGGIFAVHEDIALSDEW